LTVILGISAFYHDSAAAIVVDGEVVAAAQEERFSRKKHDASFPRLAIAFCLEQANVSVEQIDYVAFYEKPFKKFERILETHLRYAPRGWRTFCRSMPAWLRSKLYLSTAIRKGLGGKYKKRIVFSEHHESHAASAFFPSPFEQAAVLTTDGVGEWTTTSFGVGTGNQIQLQQEIVFPDSLGLLYSTFTAFCGFRVNGGEGKLMGLASYGNPVFKDEILNEIVDLKEDGSFRLNQKYFNYCAGATMASPEFAKLFHSPPRKPDSEITQREKDLAASIQVVTEEILLRIGRHIHRQTDCLNLCLAGGVALNCVANGRLLREGPFEKVWVQPAAGDAGGSVGAALFVWHQLLGKKRTPKKFASQFLGPAADENAGEGLPLPPNVVTRKFDSQQALAVEAAELLNDGEILGWFQGRMEFGPRALGNRSILASPAVAGMKNKLNANVKFRESFRPFAPLVLAERASEYFELEVESPYMLLAAKVLEPLAIPEVTHVDQTARVQTVTAEQNQTLFNLLSAFKARSGCPVLINTSFNVRGQPIVGSEFDAIDCFLRTQLDALVIGTTLYQKIAPTTGVPDDWEVARKARIDLTHKPSTLFQRIAAAVQTMTFPVRWLMSWLVLSVVYFVFIWPMSIIVRRSSGFDDKVKSNKTYWQPKPSSSGKTQYFKQY
jgi:carbamoyltransferase